MPTSTQDSSDRAVAAIEPMTGSKKFATWKRLMTSYLKASSSVAEPWLGLSVGPSIVSAPGPTPFLFPLLNVTLPLSPSP